MKYPLVLLGCSAALVTFVQPASAKSAAEIEAVARKSYAPPEAIGLRRDDLWCWFRGASASPGRFVVVTNRHVVCEKKVLCDESGVRNSYQLKTTDGQVYQVGRSTIKLLKDSGGNRLDLAIASGCWR